MNVMSEMWFLVSLVGGNDGCIVLFDKVVEVVLFYVELSRANKDGVYSACVFLFGYLYLLWNYFVWVLLLLSKVLDFDCVLWVVLMFVYWGILDLLYFELERFGYFCSAYTYFFVVLRDK